MHILLIKSECWISLGRKQVVFVWENFTNLKGLILYASDLEATKHNTKHRLSSQTSVSDKGFVNNYECMKPFCTPPPLCGRAIILTIIFALEYSKRFSCPLCEHSQIFDSPPPCSQKYFTVPLLGTLKPLNC